MSATQNLKTVFEADTRDLTRGAKQARKELKDFGKTSNEVVNSIGDAFGVDLDKLDQLTNATKEWGRKMSESGNEGTAAFGKLLQSIDATKVAIAGLGIGAAIGAFKLLTAEAENFKNTVAGANIEMQTAAYVSTYTQALHDFNAQTGKSVSEFESEWKKGFARFKANFQQNVVNALTGNMSLGQGLLGPVWGSVFGNKDQRRAADAAGTRNEERTGQLYELTRQLAAKSVEWAETEAQIAEYRRIAKDDSEGLAAQQNAIAQAEALINQRYGDEYAIREKISQLQTDITNEVGSGVEEMDKMYLVQKQAADVLRRKDELLKSINEEQKSLNNSVKVETSSRQQNAAEIQKLLDYAAKRTDDADLLTAPLAGVSTLTSGVNGPEMDILLHPKIDNKEVIDLSENLASLVEQGVTSVSESIGSLIGDLATGGDAWNNFANAALSSFGDMAISIGKMAIATGTATLGIKAALESLNGYVAIAAGAALVALGSAVKSGLSNIASGGNYSASSSVAGSNYSSSSGSFETREVNVNVTGTLVADGDQLVTVISNTEKKKYYTT